MGNLHGATHQDEAWKQQNREMVENPVYQFANLSKGGSLIDAFNSQGAPGVIRIAQNEMSDFLYSKDGAKHCISDEEFNKWKLKSSRKTEEQGKTNAVVKNAVKNGQSNKTADLFAPHEACWSLEKRGGVGETPFHLLCLMDSPVHFEVAKIVLQLYPNLSLDIYESEEYYGESALHIAIVNGDLELVQLLLEAGARVSQRANGRFFLPEDQKKALTGKTDYEGYAYYGEYPLAFAACLGNMDMYDLLLEHGASPDMQDSFGNTVLHMIVISNQKAMYRYAVRHHKLKARTNIKNNCNLTPLALACKLGRQDIFQLMLELDSIEFWSFSTTLCSVHPLHTLDSIGADGSTNSNSALMIILDGGKDDHLEMLEVGVMRQLVVEKWKTFARTRFMFNLAAALVHIIIFSICVYTRPVGPDMLHYRGPIDAVRFVSELAVVINCLAKVIYEMSEIGRHGFLSFLVNCKNGPAQTVNLVSCLLLLVCVPCRLLDWNEAEDILVILAAPCVWTILLFFARGYLLTGPFVTMIYKMVVGDLVRFGIIYLVFLSAFTQAFYFLFHDVGTGEDNDDLEKFATFPEALIKLFQMTFGEFKYDVFNLSHYSSLTKIIFCLFMILLPILLLNMLIAMMGNTHTNIISKATKEWWKQWAKIVIVMERGISKQRLLQHQRAYSVRLSEAPASVSESHLLQEQRGLVVIRVCAKSRAKRRKEAVFLWKALSDEIIRQLRRQKTEGQPFELNESHKKGQLLVEEQQTELASTVLQLAWEKDIDLNKGHTSVSPLPDNLDSNPHHVPSF